MCCGSTSILVAPALAQPFSGDAVQQPGREPAFAAKPPS
jgi:hypothetical protein